MPGKASTRLSGRSWAFKLRLTALALLARTGVTGDSLLRGAHRAAPELAGDGMLVPREYSEA